MGDGLERSSGARSERALWAGQEVSFYALEGTPQEGFSQGMPWGENSAGCEQNGYRKPSSVGGRSHYDYSPFPGG